MYRILSAFAALAALAHGQPPAAEERARLFLNLLVKNDFAAAQPMLDDALAKQLTVPALEQVWGQVLTGAGPFRRATSARLETSGKSTVVFLTCEFDKAVFDIRLPVDNTGRIGGINLTLHVDYTPPAYVDAATFHQKEVLFGSAEFPLHATLTIPNGDGPFPALVLVHGSGAADRDATLGPNKPFRDLAEGLATRGIVVLRYNKRANEYPTQVAALDRLTVKEESIDDAIAAVAALGSMVAIDHQKVFVLGHSLGGTLIPRIGKAEPGIAGLVVLGGTTRSLLDLLVPQLLVNFTLHGPISAAQEKVIAQIKEQIARAKDPALTPDAPRSQMPLSLPASYWLDLRTYHPDLLARELKQPMLILQGERDYQVTMEDFERWKKSLANRKNVEFRSYPKLNHLFMPGEGQSSDEEYAKPGHVSPAIVEDLAVWIKRQ